MMIALDEIQGWLDEISFRPFGSARWDMSVSHIDPGGDSWSIRLTVTHWVANSVGFEHWNEYADTTVRPQSFTVQMDYPNNVEDFTQAVLRHCCWAMAHEACEWFVVGPDELLAHNPHVDGEPVVSL